MKRWGAAVFLLLSLAACDGPEIRQSLAQCELDPNAASLSASRQIERLETCMQARGFVLDRYMTSNFGMTCRDLTFPQMETSCYRSDSWAAALIAKMSKGS